MTRLLLSPLLIALCLFCRKEPPISAEIKARYQKEAHEFCQSIVHCLKEDMQKNLSDPVQREHVLQRMTLDLCVENQYRSIGQLTSHPSGGSPLSNEAIYEAYSLCARAVAGAGNCTERKTVHRTHPQCQKLRDLEL
ncbi:MAG: hypothetical protein HS115_09545 [Spirochaetales bacterium]|nr:hypothetical protein [Spirochaetales bacterium]